MVRTISVFFILVASVVASVACAGEGQPSVTATTEAPTGVLDMLPTGHVEPAVSVEPQGVESRAAVSEVETLEADRQTDVVIVDGKGVTEEQAAEGILLISAEATATSTKPKICDV